MLQQIQIDTIKGAVDKAINGDKDAIGFLAILKTQQDGNSREMSALAEEIQAERGMSFGVAITGVNLAPVQLQAVRTHVAGAKNGEQASINFWKVIELQAAKGDPQSSDYLKARKQVIAADATPPAVAAPVAAVSGTARPRSIEEMLAEAEATAAPVAVVAPIAVTPPVFTPPTPVQITTDLQMMKVYRDEVVKARDEILNARDQILSAISSHSAEAIAPAAQPAASANGAAV